MTWNPEPEIAALRDYAKKFKQTKVILISLDENTNKFGVMSYGETKQKCSQVQKTANVIHKLIMDETITF